MNLSARLDALPVSVDEAGTRTVVVPSEWFDEAADVVRCNEAIRRASNASIQVPLLVLSLSALYALTMLDGPMDHVVGAILGLAAQAFWLYSTWHSRQWGIFVLAALYVPVYAAALARAFAQVFAA